MLDMYMWLCPMSLQYILHPKHSDLNVFLDPGDSDSPMNYYTTEEVLPGTSGKVKELMRKVFQGNQGTVETGLKTRCGAVAGGPCYVGRRGGSWAHDKVS